MTGAKGLIGKPGATGAAGQSNATRNATTTQPPCFGPIGKIASNDYNKTISMYEVMETFAKWRVRGVAENVDIFL